MKEVKLNLMASEVESNELPTNDYIKLINGGFLANGPLYVDELEVEEINDEKVDDVLNDLFRLDQPKKIWGEKTISNLVADKAFFQKLNGASASDVVYADEIFENSEGNIVNGDLVVFFIVGNRNFTELMEKLIFKNENSEKKFPVMKLNGTFFASELGIDYLNCLKYPEDFILASTEGPIHVTGGKKFLGDLIVDFVHIGANDIDGRFSNLLKNIRTKDSNERFYDNFKIDGVLFADTINGYTWDYFENIVRKNENRTVFTGLKTYKESAEADDVKLFGKLNIKNLDDILTKDTDQIINSNFIFRSTVFKNLTLGSTYDGVCVKCLNESIVDPTLVAALRNQKNGTDEDEHLLACLLMVFIAVSIPKLARNESSVYRASLEGHANNIHCIATAVNNMFRALFTITSQQDIEDRMKEFLALDSSSLLRL